MTLTLALRAFDAPLPPKAASAEARRLLAELLGKEGLPTPFPLPIEKEENGRPYLDLPLSDSNINIDFNLSHAGKYVVCALATADRTEPLPRVGVDVEIPHRSLSPERLATRFFAPAEIDLLQRNGFALPLFLQIWTKKEAFLKLTGNGLAGNLKKTDTTVPSSLSPTVRFASYPVPSDPEAALTLCLPADIIPPTSLQVL